MPSRAAKPIRRGTLTRDAARRQAVAVLRFGESMCAYAAGQLADGLSPEQARQAALDAAAELAGLAGALRRLTRLDLDRAQRRALAVELAASGMSQRQIAEQLGVSKKTIWADLRRLARRPAARRKSFPKLALTCTFHAPYLESRTDHGRDQPVTIEPEFQAVAVDVCPIARAAE